MSGVILLTVALDPPIKQHMGLCELADVITKGLEENASVADALVHHVQPSSNRREAATHFSTKGHVVHAQTFSIPAWTPQDVSRLRH